MTNETINIYFGNQLRERRKKAGLTLQNLADMLDVRHPTILNIEKGLSSPNANKIYLFCQIFKCQPSELFPPIEPLELKPIRKEVTITITKQVGPTKYNKL